MNINIEDIKVAIVKNGAENIGRCFSRYNYLVYVHGNPDDTTYDDVSSRPSAQWRKEIVKMLPSHNGGCHLGKFAKVPDTYSHWVADAYIEIDSGD